MSRQVKVTVGALLLFQALSCVLAVPVLNAVKQPDSVREEDGDSEYMLNRQRRRSWPVMNSYITEFLINSTTFKDSNCSALFFGQSVSQAFCSSKSIYISYSSAEAPADPVLPRNNLDNCTYVLCTNSSSQKTILGRDLIIYKRAQENQSLEVFLTRTIIGQTWEDFLGYNIIEANDSGWRVFHLESLFGAHTNRHICVNIYVRVQNDTKFLSKERVKEIFALEPLFPHEQLYKPFSAVFINGTFNIPLLKKRSIDIPEITGNTTDCVLQKHSINLQNHLSTDVILPVETDLGNCVYQKSTQEKEVDEDSPLDPQYDGLQQCEPKEFDDLFVLVQDDTSLVLTSLPDFIITKCGTQPLGEVE